MNRDFAESLVTTATGGTRGGGAQVTALGRDALARFRRMELKASKAIAADAAGFSALLKPARGRKSKST
jgi:molybdate transport system regulatory protein